MFIDIASISLDIENFRHKVVQSEREAMRLLLLDEKQHKVSELALDIIDLGGLDPSSLLIVTQDPQNAGHYIALEGNRRITALKTLITPDLALGLPTYPVFRRLSASFMSLDLTKVDCVVLDKSVASEWIKRKHYKGMGGKGTLPWNAVATARSDAAEGKFSRWMTALAFLEENGIDAEDLRDMISAKTTTIERVLTSPLVGSVLGLQFDRSGKLAPDNGKKDEACKLVEALLSAMAERTFTEPSVSTAEQQRVFLNRFADLSVLKAAGAPSQTSSSSSPAQATTGGASGLGSSGKSQPQTGPAQPAAAAKSVQTSKPIRVRKKLAPNGLRISNVNLNKFYGELRGISVETYPFVCAAIIRVFLEKSTTVFLESMNVLPLNPSPGASWRDAKLRDKVAGVLKILDPGKTNPKLRYAWDVANAVQHKLHSLDELNHAIHDHHSLPSPSEIVTTWDRFHPYFQAIFEHLEKNGK